MGHIIQQLQQWQPQQSVAAANAKQIKLQKVKMNTQINKTKCMANEIKLHALPLEKAASVSAKND